MSRILIIGGAGLLGTHLVPILAREGNDVAICDNLSSSINYRIPKEFKLYIADATDYNSLKHVFTVFNPEVVVVALAHGFSRDVVYNFFDDCKIILNSTNVISTLLSPRIKKLIFCSTSEVYGPPEPRSPVKEDRTIINCSTHHGSAKLSSETILSLRCQQVGTQFICLRIFDMYGPRIVFNPRNDVLNFLIDSSLKEEQVGLVDSKLHRDFIHVDDVASITNSIIKSNFSGTVNVGTGIPTQLRKATTSIEKIVGAKRKFINLSSKKMPNYSAVANTDLLKKIIPNWSPKIELFSYLPKLVEFRKEELSLSSNASKILDMMRSH